MNTNDIRQRIREALRHERRTGQVARLLREHLARTGTRMSADEQEQCLNFVKAYITETPDIMDAVYAAAEKAGALAPMRPIFDAAFRYWEERNDFIPDNLGLIGYADDAYLTRKFMATISKLHASRAGQPLLPVDLTPPNLVMRALIGEPIASRLDAHVAPAIANLIVQQSLQELGAMGAGFQLGGTPMPGMSQYEIDREVDVRLGAMGVV